MNYSQIYYPTYANSSPLEPPKHFFSAAFAFLEPFMRTQDSSQIRPQATESPRVLLMAQDAYGFTTRINDFKRGGADPSKTKFFIGGNDVTQNSRVKSLGNDSVEVSVKFKEPLKAQANLEVRLETNKRGEDKLESKVVADVVAKIEAPKINFIEVQDFAQESQVPYSEFNGDELTIVFNSSNVGQTAINDFGLKLTDEKGDNVSQISTKYVINVSGSESWFINNENSVQLAIPDVQTLNRLKSEVQTIFIESSSNQSQNAQINSLALPSGVCFKQELFDFTDIRLAAPNLTNLDLDLLLPDPGPFTNTKEEAIERTILRTRNCIWKADCDTATRSIFQPNRFVPPLATSPEFFGPIGITGRNIDAAVNAGEGVIQYGALDFSRRSTGIKAVITINMIGRGTNANPTPEVTGWNRTVNGNLMARGHLLAKILGGSGLIPQNLTPLIQTPVNNPCMRDLEIAVSQLPQVTQGGFVVYSTQPVYTGNNVVPDGVFVRAYWIERVETGQVNGLNYALAQYDGFEIYIRNTPTRSDVMQILRAPRSARIPARVLNCG
jgi:hypothetical protein